MGYFPSGGLTESLAARKGKSGQCLIFRKLQALGRLPAGRIRLTKPGGQGSRKRPRNLRARAEDSPDFSTALE
jgi:hypothetical protein